MVDASGEIATINAVMHICNRGHYRVLLLMARDIELYVAHPTFALLCDRSLNFEPLVRWCIFDVQAVD